MKVVLGTILSHIKKHHPDAEIQEETNQIVFQNKINEFQYPTFIKVLKDSGLVQLMTFFPGSIQEGAENDVALLLHRVNVEIDIPGFGMETQANSIFYRTMIPVSSGEIEEKLLDLYLTGCTSVCRMFAPVILAVCFKKMSYQDVLAKLEQKKAGS